MKINKLMAFMLMAVMVVAVACSDDKKSDEKDSKEKTSQWSKVEKDAFIESCEAGLANQPMIDGKKYCACMLEKLEAEFPNAIQAQNMDEKKMQEWAIDCMK
jgi:hypothetical protein